MQQYERHEQDVLIVQSAAMHLTGKEACRLLAKDGLKLNMSTYRTRLRRIRKKAREHLTGNTNEFAARHLQRVSALERISRELWKIVDDKKVYPKDRVAALKELIQLQHDMSDFDEVSQIAVQEDMRMHATQEALR